MEKMEKLDSLAKSLFGPGMNDTEYRLVNAIRCYYKFGNDDWLVHAMQLSTQCWNSDLLFELISIVNS